jgi:hypothetical protein
MKLFVTILIVLGIILLSTVLAVLTTLTFHLSGAEAMLVGILFGWPAGTIAATIALGRHY